MFLFNGKMSLPICPLPLKNVIPKRNKVIAKDRTENKEIDKFKPSADTENNENTTCAIAIQKNEEKIYPDLQTAIDVKVSNIKQLQKKIAELKGELKL